MTALHVVGFHCRMVNTQFSEQSTLIVVLKVLKCLQIRLSTTIKELPSLGKTAVMLLVKKTILLICLFMFELARIYLFCSEQI